MASGTGPEQDLILTTGIRNSGRHRNPEFRPEFRRDINHFGNFNDYLFFFRIRILQIMIFKAVGALLDNRYQYLKFGRYLDIRPKIRNSGFPAGIPARIPVGAGIPEFRQPVYRNRIRTGILKMPNSGAGIPAHRNSGTTLI